MDEVILRQVQLTQLEIAKEFARICEENNLTYMIEAGSLLGAVRHKGFIPWDDDMDFSMPREDYIKFFEISSKMVSQYKPINWYIEPNYPLPFGKFVKKGTIYKEEKQNESYGIYIDIFPWDAVPDNVVERKSKKIRMMSYRAMIRAKCGYKTYIIDSKFRFGKWLKNLPFILGASFFSTERLIRKYDEMAVKGNETQFSLMAIQSDDPVYEWNSSVEVLKSRTQYKFEDTYFWGPTDYDTYLTSRYGDYMQLPPPEKRGNQHKIQEIGF